ncbi:DMT family transporter [Marinibaculum pumilum]|uniref:DMT family transporter n=1 Tax=Marinibaculum pumilum TaxID=1766165 RepID=A0ABV7KVK0_9PROT
MSPFVWLQLFALSLLWGLSFVLVGAVVHDTGAVQVAWARIAGGALFMLLFCLAVGQRLPAGRGFWLAAAAMGLLNNIVPFSLIASGQERIGPDLAAILNATTPFFAAIAAHLFTGDERLTLPRLAGIAIGIVAVAVLIGPAAWEAIGSGGDQDGARPDGSRLDRLAGQAMVLAAACSYAAAGIFGKRFRGRPPVQLATAMLCMSAVMMTPLMLWAGAGSLAQDGAAGWGALAALGIGSTGLAYILYFRILAAAGATNVLLVTLLVPFSAAALGALLLGHGLSLRTAAALALITFGLLVFDGRPLRYLRQVVGRAGA